jgi:hypothetical protein
MIKSPVQGIIQWLFHQLFKLKQQGVEHNISQIGTYLKVDKQGGKCQTDWHVIEWPLNCYLPAIVFSIIQPRYFSTMT